MWLRLQADVFAGEYGAKRLADLKLRVIEHNVLVVSKYYTRISTARLAELLDLTPEEVRLKGLGAWGSGGRRLGPVVWPVCRLGPLVLTLHSPPGTVPE